jgi:hypothetical protein
MLHRFLRALRFPPPSKGSYSPNVLGRRDTVAAVLSPGRVAQISQGNLWRKCYRIQKIKNRNILVQGEFSLQYPVYWFSCSFPKFLLSGIRCRTSQRDQVFGRISVKTNLVSVESHRFLNKNNAQWMQQAHAAHRIYSPFFLGSPFLTESFEIMSFLFQSSGVISLFYCCRIFWASSRTVHLQPRRLQRTSCFTTGRNSIQRSVTAEAFTTSTVVCTYCHRHSLQIQSNLS